nr:hypothetical protein [Tanacetum cinerariifolium]
MAEPNEYIFVTRKNLLFNYDEGRIVEKSFVEIQGTFLVKIRDNTFNEIIRENASKHIDNFLEVVGPLKDAIQRILGFGIRRIDYLYRPCCKEINDKQRRYGVSAPGLHKKKHTPDVSVSKKKASATTDRCKGIDLLSEAALLEDSQMKKVLKQSKRETHSSQASGSVNGVGSQPNALDELQNDDVNDDDGNEDECDDKGGDNDSDDERTEFDKDESPNLNQKKDDIEEEYEDEYTPSLLTKPITEVPETLTTTATKIPLPIPPFIHLPQQSTPTPTPTTEATTSLPTIPAFSSLFRFNQRVSVLEKELSQLKQVDHSAKLLEAIKSQVLAVVEAHLGTGLGDFIQKAFQSYTAEFKKKAQAEKKRYINLVEISMKDIINDEVKTQLPQIIPKEVADFATLVIQSTITESLKNVVLAKSSVEN